MKVSGVSEDGGARIVELPERRLFIAPGFVPRLTSGENRSHPLIIAYPEAADKRRGLKTTGLDREGP